jgi:hypothetical protein
MPGDSEHMYPIEVSDDSLVRTGDSTACARLLDNCRKQNGPRPSRAPGSLIAVEKAPISEMGLDWPRGFEAESASNDRT